MKNQTDYMCKVCGLIQDEEPWGEDGKTPSFDICFCCGCEFGYQDCQISSTKSARKKWLENGAIWCRLIFKPENWSLEKQLSQIPTEYRDNCI